MKYKQEEFASGQQRQKTPDQNQIGNEVKTLKMSASVYENLYQATHARKKIKEM